MEGALGLLGPARGRGGESEDTIDPLFPRLSLRPPRQAAAGRARGLMGGTRRSVQVPRFRTMPLTSWGNHPVEECVVARPEKVRDLLAAAADPSVASVISRGLGRSYGDAALNAGGGVLLHERLNRFLAFDPETGTLECEAGVSYEEILRVFVPRGYFPPVTPGTQFVTMGGAVAADVHGKNHHREGSFAEFLESLTLLTGSGEVLRCSRTENADVFWATVGGMGLTGAILTVRLRLRPVESAYMAVDYQRAGNLDRALELFESSHAAGGSGGSGGYHYSVAWIDCLARGKSLGRCVLMGGEHASVKDLPERLKGGPLEIRPKKRRSVPNAIPSGLLNSLSVRAFNAVYYRSQRGGRRIVPYDSFFYPLDSVLHWNRFYGKRGFQQYQVVLPPETSRQGLVRLLEELARSRRGSFLAVLKTMGPSSGGMLSFPHPGWTLAVDLPHDPSLDEFLAGLDRITLEHGGRRYLAKDAGMRREAFEAMYPRLGEFCAVVRRLDPRGRVSSSLARRLGIVDGGGPGAGPRENGAAASAGSSAIGAGEAR